MKEEVVESLAFPAVRAEHIDKWVAVSKATGTLLAVGNTLTEVLKNTAGAKEKTVFKVLPDAFAG